MSATYEALLQHPMWFEKRNEIIKRDAGKCASCGATEVLQVHHRQYHFITKEQQFVKPWEYHPKLLITFCKNCHRAGEETYGKVPIKYI